MPIDIAAVKAQAVTERDAEVSKSLAKKYKVIAERRAVLTAHVDAFEAKVTAFDTAITSATNAEQVLAALETHKFPYNCINLTGVKKD